MSVQLSAQIRGDDEVAKDLGRLAGPLAQGAYVKAVNDGGYQVRRVWQREIDGAFDQATPFIRKSPKVFEATAEKLSVAVAPTLHTERTYQRGGKVGVDPQQVLQAQEFGGRRADKRSEVALRRARILPNGFQTAIPTDPYPGSHDGRGNLRGAFVAQLISYLQASSEQGYRANMTDKRKAKLRNQQGIGSIKAKKVYKTTLGVRYFVSLGNLRGHHLPPGVWAASGTHDVQLRPVLMFVRTGSYTPRLSMERIAAQADLQDYLDRRVRFRLRQALGV